MKQTPYGKKNNGASAFTLIELLVVVAIILLLIAIIIPVLRNARARAGGAVCQSNMRQIAAALMFYAAENQWVFPSINSIAGGSYFGEQSLLLEALADTIDPGSSVWFCPQTARYEQLNHAREIEDSRIGYFYWAWTTRNYSDPLPMCVNARENSWLIQGWNPNLGQLVLLTCRFRDGNYWDGEDWQYHAGGHPEHPLSEAGTHAVMLDGSVQIIAPRP